MSKNDTFSPVCCSVSQHVDIAAEEYLRVYNIVKKVIALISSTITDPSILSDLDNLQKILDGIHDDDDDDDDIDLL